MDAFQKDTLRMIDGPLEGRRLLVDEVPSWPLELHAAVAPDGRVLAIEGERAPSAPHRRAEFRYDVVMAPDGVASRGDDGCVRYYYVGEVEDES